MVVKPKQQNQTARLSRKSHLLNCKVQVDTANTNIDAAEQI